MYDVVEQRQHSLDRERMKRPISWEQLIRRMGWSFPRWCSSMSQMQIYDWFHGIESGGTYCPMSDHASVFREHGAHLVYHNFNTTQTITMVVPTIHVTLNESPLFVITFEKNPFKDDALDMFVDGVLARNWVAKVH